MPIEIERKYLIDLEKWQLVDKPIGHFYRQGYLSSDQNKVIRVRLTDKSGFLTIKGATKGMSRPEYEYAIPCEEAQELLDSFAESELIKVRYKIKFGQHIWEVDVFLGENEGLIVAEIELLDEDEHFLMPDWITEEVTNDNRYYNSNLTINPYKNWKQ